MTRHGGWIQVSQAIGEHSNHHAKVRYDKRQWYLVNNSYTQRRLSDHTGEKVLKEEKKCLGKFFKQFIAHSSLQQIQYQSVCLKKKKQLIYPCAHGFISDIGGFFDNKVLIYFKLSVNISILNLLCGRIPFSNDYIAKKKKKKN